MRTVDMMVSADHVYTMTGEGVGYLGNQSLIVDRGRIIDILDTCAAKDTYSAESNIELGNKAIFPGFVDAHMHTSCCAIRGLAQDTNNWMMYGFGPFINNMTPADGMKGSQLAIVEAINAGTTTIGDFNSNMDGVCDFLLKAGARGAITTTVREAKYRTYHPGEVYEFDEAQGAQTLDENLALFDRYHGAGDGLIRVLFGPQGADFLSESLLMKIKRIVREKKTKIHMHTSQGDRETYQIQKRYGMRAIPWLDSIGFLDEDLIAVHLTDATDEEARLVASRGASMIVCPGSIGIIDGIVPPSVVFQEAGGAVALGSDQAPGNNCHNIINEMKNVALFNKIKYQNPEIMPAYKALRMATIEGAKALGMDSEIGSLEVGKRADFIAVDLNAPTMQPIYTVPMRNIVPNLVYSARGNEVCLVVVNGQVIYRNGELTRLNQKELLSGYDEIALAIGERTHDEFWEINGTNAIFMKENKL